MAVLTTSGLVVPNQILTPWLEKVRYGSAVASLVPAAPMQFGPGQAMTYNIGEAEYVGEGANKSGSTVTSQTYTIAPFKFHKTVRWTEEVMWADEDHQLGVVQQILDLIQPALSRALDFGVFHGVNPATGTAVAAMTQRLTNTTNVVEIGASDKVYTPLDAADAAVLNDGFIPRAVALDPTWAAAFVQARAAQTEAKLYPEFTLGAGTTTLGGHTAAVSDTVRAQGVITPDTAIRGFVGDFNGIRWGIQRNIGLQLIEYGDPDGAGDLKRNNQVAFRAEVVYGWGIANLNAFAKVVDAVA